MATASEATKTALLEHMAVYRKQLEEELEAIERAMATLSGQNTPAATKLPARVTMGSPAYSDPSLALRAYAGLGPQAAVQKLLKNRPDRPWKATEARDELKRGGMATDAKNFISSVTIALNRSVSKGLAIKGKNEKGVFVYRAKKSDSGVVMATPESRDP